MKRIGAATVVVTVAAHFGYLLYVPSGGFLALRWPRSIGLHLTAVLWGIGVVVFGLPCPLTAVERWARVRADMDPLPPSGFIDRYVDGILYPSNRTGMAQASAFTAAAVSWLALASKWLRRNPSQLASRPSRLRS